VITIDGCRRVLELGAGCGIVGMVCAALGAAEVVITDGDERYVTSSYFMLGILSCT
jgi:predicted nicotinamide N-methyase